MSASARSDLRILVMSATLDPAPVSAFLNGCPIIDVPGTLYPLAIEYAPGESVAQAVTTLMPRSKANILCFLPGAREIAETIASCGTAARNAGFDLAPLHGSLDNAAQDAALSPAADRRTLIVATNVAETSLTVPGVSVVIDTGLQKVARYDADRGVDSLTTERVTLDSADQRAGRAARLGPGIVRRLWDERDRLRPHREAEIHRVDLSGPLLAILSWGADPESFEWFDRPAGDRMASAMSLLERLGAVAGGQVTTIGRQMQRLPLHPRLARVVIAANGSFEGCAAATLLSEPVPFEGQKPSTSCDLLPLLDRWSRMPPHIRRSCESLEQSARSLLGDAYRSQVDESRLRQALLAGYPDRVARRRPQKAQNNRPGPQKAQMAQNDNTVTLATGHGAIVWRESGVHDGEWLIALDVTSGRTSATTQAIVRMASRIEPEWLAPTRSELRCDLDRESGTVRAHEIDWYDEVMLREHPVAVPAADRARILAEAWVSREPDEHSRRLIQRLRFAGAEVDLTSIIAATAAEARRFDEVRLSEERLPWDIRQKLMSAAPDRLKVPSGRDMTIDYADDGSVSVSVKLQELFGLAETPRIGPARTPVTFHLLAPNGRAVQTTRDLRSFWDRTYPEIRKELRGRYPRHPWPDDPWNAPATHRTTRRAGPR